MFSKTMVLWYFRNRFVRKKQSLVFDLFRAFDQIERSNKSDFWCSYMLLTPGGEGDISKFKPTVNKPPFVTVNCNATNAPTQWCIYQLNDKLMGAVSRGVYGFKPRGGGGTNSTLFGTFFLRIMVIDIQEALQTNNAFIKYPNAANTQLLLHFSLCIMPFQ